MSLSARYGYRYIQSSLFVDPLTYGRVRRKRGGEKITKKNKLHLLGLIPSLSSRVETYTMNQNVFTRLFERGKFGASLAPSSKSPSVFITRER